jgi:hypothetical protein
MFIQDFGSGFFFHTGSGSATLTERGISGLLSGTTSSRLDQTVQKNIKRMCHEIRPAHLRDVVVVLVDHVVRAAQVMEVMVVPVLLIIVIVI